MSRRHRGAWRGRVFGNVNMGSAWSLFPPPNTGRMGKGWGRARESESRRAYPGVNERQKVGDAWGRPGPRRLKLLIAHIVYPFAFRRELSCPLAFLFSCFHESGRNFGGGDLSLLVSPVFAYSSGLLLRLAPLHLLLLLLSLLRRLFVGGL